MTEPTWTDPTPEVPRDRWSRPLIIPPGGGKAIAYTRCTTYIDCLDDPFNLTQWKRRMVARGLSLRPDLLLRVVSLGPEPEKAEQGGDAYKQWKKQLDQVCDQAVEAAKASASATIGTALHALTERMDRGLDVGVVPEAYLPHLTAYAAATANMTALHIERFCVHDGLKIGGTPDRILKIDGHNKPVIADLKTGDVVFGVGKIAMQLAVYSRSHLYDPRNGTRTPIDVDQTRGLIIALDAKQGGCSLHWVDLTAGWEAVQLTTQVRAWRTRSKDLSTPYTEAWEADPDVLSAREAAALETAIRNASSNDELVQLWTAAGPCWDAEHTALAAARKQQLAHNPQPALAG